MDNSTRLSDAKGEDGSPFTLPLARSSPLLSSPSTFSSFSTRFGRRVEEKMLLIRKQRNFSSHSGRKMFSLPSIHERLVSNYHFGRFN